VALWALNAGCESEATGSPDTATAAPSVDATTPDATTPDPTTPDATSPDPMTPEATLPDAARSESVRGRRYYEVLLAFLGRADIEVQVWGTQGLNDCPPAEWATVDSEAVRDAAGATAAVLNGPRYWTIDGVSATRPDGEPRLFGELEMQQLATLMVAPGKLSSMPYTERAVLRDSEFEFRAGAEVYELVAPNGVVYIMQSYAQIADADLTEAELSTLGERLSLPEGWQYRARTLETALTVRTPGEATVIQDDLQNSDSRSDVGE
jgi:hypothetical protein